MFNILIVDDDTERNFEIQELINKIDINSNIDYATEVKQAMSMLEKNYYDLLILDVQLPSLNNRGTIISGGVHILDSIINLDTILKPSHIIGITAYDDKYEEVKEKFDKRLCCLIKYIKGSCDWTNSISEKIYYLYQSRLQFLKSNSIQNIDCKFDCAIITAVDNEWKELLGLNINWENFGLPDDPTTYYRGKYCVNNKEINIVIAKQSQMGMSAASNLTTKIIKNFSPKVIFMVGIAAGCKSEVELGDIIIANESWDYGSGKVVKESNGSLRFKQETHQLNILPSIKEILSKDYSEVLYDIRKSWNNGHGEKISNDIKIHIGAMASGASVVQNEDLIDKFVLPQNRKLLGIDMETYGVYFAAKNTTKKTVEAISIKAVSDFANSDKNDDYQQYCSYISTSFAIKVLPEILNSLNI